MGFRDRPRVPGQARLGRRLHAHPRRAAAVRHQPPARPDATRCDRSSSRRCRRRSDGRACGPATSGRSSAAPASDRSSSACSTRSSDVPGQARPWARSCSVAPRPTRATPRSLRTTARRAEGALPQAAARGHDVLGVLDDRAAGRIGPEDVHHQRGRWTVTSGSSTARSGSPPTRRWAEILLVLAVTDPDEAPFAADVDVRRPDRHAGRRVRPPRRRRRLGRGRRRRRPQLHPLQRRAHPPGRTSSVVGARASSSPRPGWRAAACTTRCAASATCGWPST